MALSSPQGDFSYGRVEVVQGILLGWFPAFVAFVLIPFDLYLPNQEDFGFNIGLLFPFLLVSLLWMLVLAALMLTVQRCRIRLPVALFYSGVFLALTDLLFPVRAHVGFTVNRAMWVREVAVPVGIEVIVAVGLAICYRALAFKPVRTVGSVFVAILLVLQTFTLSGRISPDSVVAMGGRLVYEYSARPQRTSGSSLGPNVYHLVFDGFGSAVFDEAVTSDVLEDLDGFTFFRKARANYIWTNYSMASYLTGTFYRAGDLERWLNLRRNEGALLKLANAGYYLTQYVPVRYYMHNKTSHLVDLVDVASIHRMSESIQGFPDFLDLWLDRVIPRGIGVMAGLFRSSGRSEKSLHRDSLPKWTRSNQDELARFLAGRTNQNLERKEWIRKIYQSRPLMARLLAEESSLPGRGQYVHLHTYITHEPHDVLDGNCRLCGGMKPRDQARCALRFVKKFTDKLKALGRYHGSVIIIQADHGSSIVGPSDPSLRMPASILDEMVSADGLPGSLLYNRTFPLLLIKPPDTSGHPMRISDAPVQLADIPATLCKFLGLKEGEGVGKSVFSIGESEEREIHMYFGFAWVDKHGKVQWAGKQHGPGKAFHVSFTSGKGYKRYPRIPFQWD